MPSTPPRAGRAGSTRSRPMTERCSRPSCRSAWAGTARSERSRWIRGTSASRRPPPPPGRCCGRSASRAPRSCCSSSSWRRSRASDLAPAGSSRRVGRSPSQSSAPGPTRRSSGRRNERGSPRNTRTRSNSERATPRRASVRPKHEPRARSPISRRRRQRWSACARRPPRQGSRRRRPRRCPIRRRRVASLRRNVRSTSCAADSGPPMRSAGPTTRPWRASSRWRASSKRRVQPSWTRSARPRRPTLEQRSSRTGSASRRQVRLRRRRPCCGGRRGATCGDRGA